MKKICLLFLFFLPLIVFGQKFVLTPDGLRDSSDVSKDYVVVSEENKSAGELYNAAKSYVNQTMKDPKFAIVSDVENDYIRYNMFVPGIASIKKMVVMKVDAMFTVEMRFKDGRIRYNITDISFPIAGSDNEVVLVGSNWGSWHFFDKKGKSKLNDQKENVEAFFNQGVDDLKGFISNHGNNDVEDW